MALVSSVAEYIIGLCETSNLKLQKLLYYSQGVYMVELGGKPLFDAEIEAWECGPVVPEIYEKYKSNGFDVINLIDIAEVKDGLDLNEILTIDMVLEFYGDMSEVALASHIHSEDPWKSTYVPNKRHVVIPKERIYSYFKDSLEISELESVINAL